jgi:hypothetical protein
MGGYELCDSCAGMTAKGIWDGHVETEDSEEEQSVSDFIDSCKDESCEFVQWVLDHYQMSREDLSEICSKLFAEDFDPTSLFKGLANSFTIVNDLARTKAVRRLHNAICKQAIVASEIKMLSNRTTQSPDNSTGGEEPKVIRLTIRSEIVVDTNDESTEGFEQTIELPYSTIADHCKDTFSCTEASGFEPEAPILYVPRYAVQMILLSFMSMLAGAEADSWFLRAAKAVDAAPSRFSSLLYGMGRACCSIACDTKLLLSHAFRISQNLLLNNADVLLVTVLLVILTVVVYKILKFVWEDYSISKQFIPLEETQIVLTDTRQLEKEVHELKVQLAELKGLLMRRPPSNQEPTIPESSTPSSTYRYSGEGFPKGVVRIGSTDGTEVLWRGFGALVKDPDSKSYLVTAHHVIPEEGNLVVSSGKPGMNPWVAPVTDLQPIIWSNRGDRGGDFFVLPLSQMICSKGGFATLPMSRKVYEQTCRVYGFRNGELVWSLGHVIKDKGPFVKHNGWTMSGFSGTPLISSGKVVGIHLSGSRLPTLTGYDNRAITIEHIFGTQIETTDFIPGYMRRREAEWEYDSYDEERDLYIMDVYGREEEMWEIRYGQEDYGIKRIESSEQHERKKWREQVDLEDDDYWADESGFQFTMKREVDAFIAPPISEIPWDASRSNCVAEAPKLIADANNLGEYNFGSSKYHPEFPGFLRVGTVRGVNSSSKGKETIEFKKAAEIFPELNQYVFPNRGAKAEKASFSFQVTRRRKFLNLKKTENIAVLRDVEDEMVERYGYVPNPYPGNSWEGVYPLLAKKLWFIIRHQTVNRQASPGLPWIHLGYNTLGQLLDGAPELVFRAVMVRLFIISERGSSIPKGSLELVNEFYCDPLRIFIKQEPHSIEKAKQERWRLIFSVSFVDQLVGRVLHQDLNDAMRDKLFSHYNMVGMNLSGTEPQDHKVLWDYLFGDKGPENPSSLDISGWDMSVLAEELLFESRVRKKQHRLQPGDWMARALDGLCHTEMRSVVVFSDGTALAQQLPGIQTSGKISTCHGNCVIRTGVGLAMARIAGVHNYDIRVMGDDSVETYVERASEIYEGFAKKVKFQSVEERDFCSNLFFPDKHYSSNPFKILFNLLNQPPSVRDYELVSQFYREMQTHPRFEEFVSAIDRVGWKDPIYEEQIVQAQGKPGSWKPYHGQTTGALGLHLIPAHKGYSISRMSPNKVQKESQMGNQRKQKQKQRKRQPQISQMNRQRNANFNRNANFGNRGRNVPTRARVGGDVANIYRKRHGNRAYSRNAAGVLDQVQYAGESSTAEAICRPGVTKLSSVGAAVYTPIVEPESGYCTYNERRLTVGVGSAGWGFAMVRWYLTGPSGGEMSAGGIMNTTVESADCIYTTTAFASASLDFEAVGLGLAGIPGVAATDTVVDGVATRTEIKDFPTTEYGSYLYACLGQKISLAANKTNVADRGGQIAVLQRKGAIPTVMTGSILDNNTRAQVFDASNLTSESEFTTTRPALACGQWILPFVGDSEFEGWGSAAGTLTNHDHSGYTMIVVQGSDGDEFVFDVQTRMAWGGSHIPPQQNHCNDDQAYSVVSCGRATGTRSTHTQTESDKSVSNRETHRAMEKSASSRVPEFLMDGLLNIGSKMLKRVVELAI